MQFIHRRLVGLHRDQNGSISIASVFALLLIVFLLGMVMNSSRQVDRKVKMQNAVDQATRAGSLQLARSMNSFAFTNHLLSDVFALTAFFREAREQNAAQDTVEILDHWRRTGEALSDSEFPRFRELGEAILEHVPLEEELVASYSEWAYQAAEQMLPVFEAMLADEMIPEFQRALLVNGPPTLSNGCRSDRSPTWRSVAHQYAASGGALAHHRRSGRK